MTIWYDLDEEKNVVPLPEGKYPDFSKSNRVVNQTNLSEKGEEVLVSTVFLGLDHSFGLNKEKGPLIFETMIFGGRYDQYQMRYHTYKEAQEAHYKIVDCLKKKDDPNKLFD